MWRRRSRQRLNRQGRQIYPGQYPGRRGQSAFVSMKIEFILFHRQVSSLLISATGEFRLIMRKKGVTGQLPRIHFMPGAAVSTPGLILASHNSYLAHGYSLIVPSAARELPLDCFLPRRPISGDNQNNSGKVLLSASTLPVPWFSLAYFAAFGGGALHPMVSGSPGILLIGL
jgi:hypothetical protein